MSTDEVQGLVVQWSQYYLNRYQWIEGAISRHIESIPEGPLREIVKGSFGERVAVGLYGLTQVGKTTFVLDLLGIDEEYKAELNEVLRCGSRIGNSATPTAMIYRQGTGTDFVYIEGKQTKRLTIDSLRNELIHLRERVENGALQDLTEVMIDIPSSYFNEKWGRVNIQIIDLPGVGSKNDAEYNHVNRILTKYLPVVSMVFVFTKIDKISGVYDLFNNGTMNEYLGWKYLGSRYRLVTSYTFTDKTIQTLINDGKMGNLDQLKAHIQDSAITDLKSLPSDVKVYPMEMGDSLHGLKKEMAPYYEVIIKYIDEVKEQIILDINASANKTAQVKSAAKVGGAILRLRDDLIKLKQNEQHAINQEIGNLNNRIQQSNILINESESEISELFARIDRCGTNTRPELNDYSGEKNRDNMKNHLGKCEQTVIHWLNEIWNSFNRNGTPTWIGSDAYKGDIKEILKEIRNVLNNMSFNEPGWWHWGGPDDETVNWVHERTKAIRNLCSGVLIEIKNERQTIKSDLENDYVGQLRYRISQQRENINTSTNSVQNCNGQVAALNHDISEIERRYNQEYERIGGFNHYLNEEFETFFNYQLRNLPEKKGIDTVLQLCYCKALIDTLNEIELANN